MPNPIAHDAELLTKVADLIADYPEIPLVELASSLERRADAYDNGANRAFAVAAELRRQAASTTL